MAGSRTLDKEEIERRIQELEKEKEFYYRGIRGYEKLVAQDQKELEDLSISKEKRRALEESKEESEGGIQQWQKEARARDEQINKLTALLEQKAAALLSTHTEMPGVVLSLSEPPRPVTITPRGKIIDLEDEMGMSITIPKDAVTKETQMTIAASFSGAYEAPDDMEPVSPAYIVTTEIVEFRDYIQLKLHHTACLETTEESENMVVMRASSTPVYEGPNSSPVYKFMEVNGIEVDFNQGNRRFAVVKVKSFSVYRIFRRMSLGSISAAEDMFKEVKRRISVGSINLTKKHYSARLYKSIAGAMVTAIFCVCPDHPIYHKHCNEAIAQQYPNMSDKAKWTFIGSLVVDKCEVGLIETQVKEWKISMDRSMILRDEVDKPDEMNIAVSDFEDYPPRILINLSRRDEKSASVILTVTGLKRDCSFSIVEECVVPESLNVDTKKLMTATKEFGTEIVEVFEEYASPLVTLVTDMVGIMMEVEPLLHDPSSIEALVEKIAEIQMLTKTLLKQAEGLNNVGVYIAKVTMISHQFKTVAPAMRRNASKLFLWQKAVDILTTNSINLMKAIKELLKAVEIDAATSKGVTLKSMRLIKWKGECFRLVEMVSYRWKSFGDQLNISDDLLSSWNVECLGDATKCWMKVMGHWLARGGTCEYKPTWEGLYELLKDVQYAQVAAKLEQIIKDRNK